MCVRRSSLRRTPALLAACSTCAAEAVQWASKCSHVAPRARRLPTRRRRAARSDSDWGPQKAVTGQYTLALGPDQEGRAARRGRRFSISQSRDVDSDLLRNGSLRDSAGGAAERPGDAGNSGAGGTGKGNATPAGPGSVAQGSIAARRGQRALTPFEAARKSVLHRIWAYPRTLLSRMLGRKAMDEDENQEMTIGPYVRFVWILSLGILDLFLVLVMI